MINVPVRDGETYKQALGRLLTEETGGTGFAELGRLVAHELTRSEPAPSPDCLHPLALPDLELEERMTLLAESFPNLRGRGGVRPFDPVVLGNIASARVGGASPATRMSAAFMCMVWNGGAHLTPEYRFDLVAASSWDRYQWAAFRAWAARPWWA